MYIYMYIYLYVYIYIYVYVYKRNFTKKYGELIKAVAEIFSLEKCY